ncbi:MAG: DUF4276 family protein [Gammaproteobacteria bacterium]
MLEKLNVMVEEPSMGAALDCLLPALLGHTEFQIVRFQCKDDLLKKAPERLQAYASWLPIAWRILVLVDRDDDDCRALKAKLESIAARAGLMTKTAAQGGTRFQVVNRIAVEELEAWFFGDWTAVQAAYPRVPATVPRKARFRDPDAIAGGTWEAIERVLKRAGYFSTGVRKLELARSVTAHMVPQRNRSRSFQAFTIAVAAAMV